VRVALASDRSFTSYAEALANVGKPPMPADSDLYWKQQHLDVLLEYPIASERAEFSIHPRLARLGFQVVTSLRFLPPGGAERAFELHGDPGLVRLDRAGITPRGASSSWASAHPRRHRPPAVHRLPGDPVPPAARAGDHRHRLHRSRIP
jgi:hypothetical protein